MKNGIIKIKSGLNRREFITTSTLGVAGLTLGCISTNSKVKSFTILHTNDLHSNLIGVGPISDYSPDSLNNDSTIGGIERIASIIADRKRVREKDGPVLVLDIGDFTIGTPFGGAFSETGAELQCLALAGFDATTLGNHEFDSGPDALARGISRAQKAGNIPTILAANTDLSQNAPDLIGLKELQKSGILLSHKIIDRGGIRFGLFGIMGPDSIQFTINPGSVTFPDPIKTAKEMAARLRSEGAEVVICMSHGGVREPESGAITEGDDIELAKAVPEIDIIVGAHTHTFMHKPVIENGIPIVQAGCYGQAVGELVVRMENGKSKVSSYQLHEVNDSILGDSQLALEMLAFKEATSKVVFNPRGFSIDEQLAVIDQDWPNTFFDLEKSLPIGNLMTDAIRYATKTDIALNAAGMVRAGLKKGSSGIQSSYDIFLLAPLGIGVRDESAGGSLIVSYLTGNEIKNCLEYLLVGNPNLPGQYFPRVSGMRFKFDETRPKFDWVTQIELGDLDNGYRTISISTDASEIYSVSCNLFFGLILKSIPQTTKGVLRLAPKKKDGTLLTSRTDALPEHSSTPFLLPPHGIIDENEVFMADDDPNSLAEIKEWQAIMNYLKSNPNKNDQGISILSMDEQAMENRAIKVK